MKVKCPSCKFAVEIKAISNKTPIVCSKCNHRFYNQAKKQIECDICKEIIVASEGCNICKNAEHLSTSTRLTSCMICNKKTNRYISSNGLSYFICPVCNYNIFNGYTEYESATVVVKASELKVKHNLLIAYAINHVLGRYTLEEAIRRTKLKLKEGEGGSTDMFDKGTRIPGNFRSNNR